jgi:proteic killer suppression protein
MDIEYDEDDYQRLVTDVTFTLDFDPSIVKSYRKKIQFIRGAATEADIYNWKSLHFEKLKGDRKHQHSMRINDQFRLVVEFVVIDGIKRIKIIKIEDYH